MAFDRDEKGCLRVHWELTKEVMDYRSGGCPVDEFGDHMSGCKSSLPTRTRLWHDSLVEVLNP